MNAFKNRIGVTIEEGVSNALNLASDVSVRNIGLLVERLRGVDGVPLLVNNLKEDNRIFGEHSPNMYSSYVVENLFNNTGGYPANVYQIRVVGTGSLASKVKVTSLSVDAQTFTSNTTQNATALQSQVNALTVSNVEVGDVFNLVFAGNDNSGTTPFSHTASFTATTTEASDVLTGLKGLLDTFIQTLTDNYNTSVVGTALQITGAINQPYTTTPTTVNNSGGAEIFELVAGRQGKEDKGGWGNALSVKVYPIGHTNGSSEGYRMEVFYKGYLVETYLSNGADWKTLVDSVNLQSEFVLINPTDLNVALLNNVFEANLTGGVYVAPTEADMLPKYNSVTQEAEGMAKFEGVDVQIMACPEIFTLDFAKKCEAFARTQNKFFIFSLPYLATESVMETYYNGLFTPDQSFASSYLNWVEVPADNDGNKIWIPAIGYVLGAGYLKKAGLNNGYVWIPPAGVETNARGIYRITHENLSEDKLSRYVKLRRTNVIKHVKNVGFAIYSSRTYSNNPLFESIHIRLETNWIIENLGLRNEKFIQKLYTPTLKKDMEVDNSLWFKNIYEQGGIERTIPFEDAVVVEVSVSRENRKEAEMDIYWIPPECLEHIHIRVNRNDGILILNF